MMDKVYHVIVEVKKSDLQTFLEDYCEYQDIAQHVPIEENVGQIIEAASNVEIKVVTFTEVD